MGFVVYYHVKLKVEPKIMERKDASYPASLYST